MKNEATTETGKQGEGKMVRTRKQLREHADESGVIKRNGVSIKIWEDGTILRNDVRLDFARPMTIKDAVRALGLEMV